MDLGNVHHQAVPICARCGLGWFNNPQSGSHVAGHRCADGAIATFSYYTVQDG